MGVGGVNTGAALFRLDDIRIEEIGGSAGVVDGGEYTKVVQAGMYVVVDTPGRIGVCDVAGDDREDGTLSGEETEEEQTVDGRGN